MKFRILKITAFVCLTGLAISGCEKTAKQEAERVEEAQKEVDKAKDNVDEATRDLNQARLDSANDYAKFKEESERKLIENDQKIAELKAWMASETKHIRTKYEKEVDELNQKNDRLKNRIKENKETAADKWDNFKKGFNNDLDEVGKAISSLATKNKKK